MTDEQKKWIDEASYEDLLSKWRFAPIGDPFFHDWETVEYYSFVMKEKREEDIEAAVAISKKIGWS